MKNRLISASAMILIGVSVSSCLSSVSTKMVRKQEASTQDKAKILLDKAWLAQGMDSLSEHSVYEVQGVDKWQKMIGKMGKMWPENESEISLKFGVGTFDGSVLFLDGKRKGAHSGVQSQKFYQVDSKGESNFDVKRNDKIVFGINAFQYFFELIDRLRNAPIIEYAGETVFREQTYDMVFVTWGKIKKHKDHDQYNLWINRKTGVLEFCEFTIHDPYLIGGSMLGGSIEFADFKTIDGVSIPHTQYIYLGKPKEKTKKFMHRLTVSSFKFDSFNQSELYPKNDLKRMGDVK